MKNKLMQQIIFFLGLFLGAQQLAFAQCTQTLSPGDNIASAVSSAAGGATICLNNGSYGSLTLANISKSSYVTIRSVNSKGATLGNTNIGNSDYIRIEDVVIGGGLINACSQHIQIANSTFTSGLTIRADGCSPNDNLDYTIDGNTFNKLNPALWEGRLSIGLVGSNSGIKIKNNIFGGGGCSDGIQLVGGAGGVEIGPGNIFRDLIQGSCSAHVDAIQTYGAGPGNVIKENYFVNNSVHIGIYDGGSTYTVKDNIFDTPNSVNYQAIQMGGIHGMLMEHNTFINTTLGIGTKSANSQHTGWIVQNNIFNNSRFTASGDQPGCGSDCIMRYNLKSRGGTTAPTGTNNITGDAVWIGSGSVSAWANWQLAPGSPGKSAGNDGQDMGATSYGTGTGTDTTAPISAPKNLRLGQ